LEVVVADHVAGKSIVVTGAGGGFGKLTAEMAAARGAKLTCADVRSEAAEATAAGIREAGGQAQAVAADVSQMEDMRAVAKAAVDAYGAIDVMINNAGVMPLAFLADHEKALESWNRCIDVNFRGVMNGTLAVYDQMIAQGRGHVINLSSIYGNRPAGGGAVYGATKAAVDYFSHALRQEGRGRIKVTVIKPSGVSSTGLGATVVNGKAAAGVAGHFAEAYYDAIARMRRGDAPAAWTDQDDIAFAALGMEQIADAILYAIDQPWGVAVSDMTVRAAGDFYVL
jgi:NADP-dependent 3-hydroxy acid dehydrogenase YdfG